MNNCCYQDAKCVCKVLSVAKCKYPSCSFYMTEGDRQKSMSVCDERLCSLPINQQGYIADKYYQGRREWRRQRSQTF